MQLFAHHASIPGTLAKDPAATQLEDEVEAAKVVVDSVEEEVVMVVGVSGARSVVAAWVGVLEVVVEVPSVVVAWVVVAWEGVLEVVVEAAAVLEEDAVDVVVVVAVVVEAEVEEDISAST